MLGTAALVAGQRIVVVEDVDHRLAPVAGGTATSSRDSSLIAASRVVSLRGPAGRSRSAKRGDRGRGGGRSAGRPGVRPLLGDQRRRALDDDGQQRLRQQAQQARAQPVEHHLVEPGIDGEVDQRVEGAAVGDDGACPAKPEADQDVERESTVCRARKPQASSGLREKS